MAKPKKTIGNRLAPPRFLLFLGLLVPGAAAAAMLGSWRLALMAGFDLAALVFLASLAPLFRENPGEMRRQAAANDANRGMLLVVTGIVMAAILTAVGAELHQESLPPMLSKASVVATLAIAWVYSNMVYALHYTHLFYLKDAKLNRDLGGIDFPGTKEPIYWDFVYFAFTLGMTFQTSDVDVTSQGIRRVAVFHCLAAFVYNLGVIAFTINVLGSH
jgi:uncharacterized membrane protein